MALQRQAHALSSTEPDGGAGVGSVTRGPRGTSRDSPVAAAAFSDFHVRRAAGDCAPAGDRGVEAALVERWAGVARGRRRSPPRRADRSPRPGSARPAAGRQSLIEHVHADHATGVGIPACGRQPPRCGGPAPGRGGQCRTRVARRGSGWWAKETPSVGSEQFSTRSSARTGRPDEDPRVLDESGRRHPPRTFRPRRQMLPSRRVFKRLRWDSNPRFDRHGTVTVSET